MLKSLSSEVLKGAFDYYRFPDLRTVWGGPFNGQPLRQALFRDLIDRFRPASIIETGTYRGTTTEFMARTALPIFSVEVVPRNYGFAMARFWHQRNVTIRRGNSPEVLRTLFDGDRRFFNEHVIFAYLDAHWNADLPLADELDLIFDRCPRAISMIDDFQVPFDAGYGYDDYGSGKALTSAYIASAVRKYELHTFYPSVPSREEGGARRGCAVLAKAAIHSRQLGSVPLLRMAERYPVPD